MTHAIRRSARVALLAAGLLAVASVAAPALAWAAGAGGPEAPTPAVFGSAVVNFLIYVGLIVFLVRKPAAAFFEARRANIAAEMEAARAAREAAEAQLREVKQKLADFDAERTGLLTEFRELGEQERRRIVAEAEGEAARIVRDAELAAENEVRRARGELETRMVDLALELAEKELNARLDPTLHGKLIDDGIEALARDAQG